MSTQNIALPEGWTAPKFQLGQTVFIEGTYNQAFTVMGLLFTTRGKYEEPFWSYQLSDHPKSSILHRWC